MKENTQSNMNAFDKDSWTEDEKFYFGYVDQLVSARTDKRISNGRPLHAIYLIHAFLRNAVREVCLFSGSLRRIIPDGVDEGTLIYSDPNILSAVKGFLSQEGSHLKIVLERDIDINLGSKVESHPLIATILKMKSENNLVGSFEIRQADKEQLTFLRANDFCHHMMVMDDQVYRLETDHDQAKAYVNFGDKGTATALSKIFDDILFNKGVSLVSA